MIQKMGFIMIDMNLRTFLIVLALSAIVLTADEGDWVDPNRLPVPFFIHPFFGGYLNITAQKSLYYIYTPS